jgi:pyruvate dehydrogenase E1 component beta subunit
VVPSTPYDAKGLLISAIRDDNPVMFFEQKLLYRQKGPVPEQAFTVPLGAAEVKKIGKDMTLVTYGRMLPTCLQIAHELSEEGIDIEIVDPRTLMPLDKQTLIASAQKTGKVMIVHEAVQTGGVGGEIAAVIADSEAFFYLDAPIRRVCGLDVPIPYCLELEREVVPSPDRITRAIRQLMQ